MANKWNFGKVSRVDRTSDSEQFVRDERGNLVACIEGHCDNVGSFLCPQWRMYEYAAEVYDASGDEVAQHGYFKTRPEAVAFVKRALKEVWGT